MSDQHQSTHEVAERTRRVEQGKAKPRGPTGPGRRETTAAGGKPTPLEAEQLQPDGR